MGSCVSVHKNQDSAMRARLSFVSKTDDKLLIPSPTKEKPLNGEYPVAKFGLKSQSTNLKDFGSKEETFFDSKAWLDSDCEDDFFSVNGDFTPSRGNTPNYQSKFIQTPPHSKSSFVEPVKVLSEPEPSPNSKRKRLSELFRESFSGDKFSDGQIISIESLEGKATNLDISRNSTNETTPYVSRANSACSSERTPNIPRAEKERLSRAIHCCLPSLGSSRGSIEGKKGLSCPGDNGEG